MKISKVEVSQSVVLETLEVNTSFQLFSDLMQLLLRLVKHIRLQSMLEVMITLSNGNQWIELLLVLLQTIESLTVQLVSDFVGNSRTS